MTRPSRSAMTVWLARRWRSVWETVAPLIPVAAARSETLIGPAALMQVSSVSRVGSASTANCRARAWITSGLSRAAMAWQIRSASMTR